MLIASPPHERLVRGGLNTGHRDLARTIITGRPGSRLEKRQGLTRVRPSQPHEASHGLVGDRKPTGQATLIAQRSPDKTLKVLRPQRMQRQQQRS